MAGTNVEYCRPTTQMTALHWLAYNNDGKAIEVMLKYQANHYAWTHDMMLPVDIAGTVPSYAALDTLLEYYSTLN